MLVDTNPNQEVPHVRSRKVKPSNINQSIQSQPQEAAQDKKTLRKLTYQLIEAVVRTNVAWTNVNLIVGICSRCSQEATFKVLSKLGQ